MEILSQIGSWAKKLTEIGISLISLAIVIEILFGGISIPFWPNLSVVNNIMDILGSLSNEGLLGLVGVFVLYHLFKDKM
jgi:hypothetical protein